MAGEDCRAKPACRQPGKHEALFFFRPGIRGFRNTSRTVLAQWCGWFRIDSFYRHHRQAGFFRREGQRAPAWPAMAGQRAIPAVDKPMAESPDQSGQRILAIAQEYAAAHSNDEKTRVMRQLAEAMWSRPLVAQYSRGGVSLPDELLQAMARDVSGNTPDAWMNEFRSLKLEGYVADRRRTELLVQAWLAATGTRHAPREIFLEPYQDSARIGGLVEDEYAVSYWIRAGE